MLPSPPPPPEERPPPPRLPPKNLRGRELGLLVAVVDRARNLSASAPEEDAGGALFVEVELTGSVDPRARTRAHERAGQGPVWDEEFRFRLFEVDGSPRQHLVIRVQRRYNRDGEVELELVGEARIVVDGSFDAFDQWVDLKRDGKYQGEVYLELTYYRPEQPSPRASVELTRPRHSIDGRAPHAQGGVPRLAHEFGAMHLRDTTTHSPSIDVAHPRRTSTEARELLPLPGEPDTPQLPAALRPGRPTRQAPPPPEPVEPRSQYGPARLPSPGAQSTVSHSDHAQRPDSVAWSGTPSHHAASYPPARVASALPAIAVSQPTLLASATYPAPMQQYAPAFGAPLPSTTPLSHPASQYVPPGAHPQHLPQAVHHPASHNSAPVYHASPEPSPPCAMASSPTSFFPSSSLPPRSSSPSPARPPVPPRPSSSASVTSLGRMPGALPVTPPLATCSSSDQRPPSAASRLLPPNPAGDIRPSPTPSLESKHREASSQGGEADEPPPPSYASDASGSTVTLTPARHAAAVVSDPRRREEEEEALRRARIVEEQRVRMEEERTRADEARRRREVDAARREEEDKARRRVQQEEGERRRRLEEAQERAARIERERLAAVEASQRAREARRRQEEDDARIAAQLAAEVERAEQERRAADEEAVRRLLEEEQAAASRAQREREREDEEFARRLREEERRREAEERRRREDEDEALARRLREDEDAERQRRMVEDERIARSLAEQDGAGDGEQRAAAPAAAA